MQARLELYLGPMFSGKTTKLAQRAAELAADGLRVCTVKHSKDTRWASSGVLATHDGMTFPATFTAETMAQVVDFVHKHR